MSAVRGFREAHPLGSGTRSVKVALLIACRHKVSRPIKRSESLDSFYKIKLDVTRNKRYFDVSRVLWTCILLLALLT